MPSDFEREASKSAFATGSGNFSIAADFSSQICGNDRLWCWALAALKPAQIDDLNAAIANVLIPYAGKSELGKLELHAKEIWNGHERAKSPFKTLARKSEVKRFFSDVALVISAMSPHIVVGVSHISSTELERIDTKSLKNTLLFSALSRLDYNTRLSGEGHIGGAELLLDKDNDALIHSDSIQKGFGGIFMPEIGIQDIVDGKIVFQKQIDPRLKYSDSCDSRLIQVADLSAYFVGKYLVSFAKLYKILLEERRPFQPFLREMSDSNFWLSLWDSLNIEVVVSLDSQKWKKRPSWLVALTKSQDAAFEAGIDLGVCSVREAIRGSGERKERKCGIGYWSFAKSNGIVGLLEQPRWGPR